MIKLTKYLMIPILLIISSCTLIPESSLGRHQDRYINCILKLNDGGIKQSLLKELCDGAFHE